MAGPVCSAPVKAARRILSGMGTKEKDLCAVERSLGIERDPDETVFERASSVWRKTCGWLSRSGISCIDWIETRPSDMEALAEEAVERPGMDRGGKERTAKGKGRQNQGEHLAVKGLWQGRGGGISCGVGVTHVFSVAMCSGGGARPRRFIVF